MEPVDQIQSLIFMDKIRLSAKTGFHIFKLFKIAFRTFFGLIYKCYKHFYKIGQIAFALTLDLHNDNNIIMYMQKEISF